MFRVPARLPGGLAALGSGALLILGLGGCQLKHPVANVVTGKQLFVQKCASCHTLSHADSKGDAGPNLDDAFRQDRADGMKSASVEGLVAYWIQYPSAQGVMPAKLVSGQKAQDIAAYVAAVAAQPGQDTGALALAVQSVAQHVASERNGTVEIDADPTGQLRFVASSATATAGKVTLRMKNMSTVPHDIAIEGGGVSQTGGVVSNGGVSTVVASLKPGAYTFYCSVDGHATAGMKGTLTVK
jgi:plastocyanin